MTGQQRPGGDRPPPEIEIDITTAHPARVHNYLAGGDANFAVDRDAVEKATSVLPGGLATARRAVRSMAAFHVRVIRWLVAEAGVTQFLELGTAVPAGEDVHEIAQSVTPGIRVVYVGDDPTVLAHAHAMRRSSPEAVTAYVHGSLLEVEAVLRQAGATLDLDQPVALVLPASLNFVADEDDPHGILARFVDGVVPGSYVALTHTSHEIRSVRMQEAADRFGKLLGDPYVVRGRDQIARFFDGLVLVEPGLVQIDEWRPPPSPSPDPDPDPDRRPVPIYGGLGRKP